MSYYSIGDSFKWFIARVVDIKDPEFLGRVKIRVIHDQTGDLGDQKNTYGLADEDLLWAWPISAIQSASLSWKKVSELEGYPVPDWIDAVGLSPTGIAVGSTAFGFYLDGSEANIPLIFGTYHKLSLFPEPGTNPKSMLQDTPPDEETTKEYFDVGSLAKGFYIDPARGISWAGQTLPKEPYSYSKLWNDKKSKVAPVDEMPSAYKAQYPYNTTYTTKSGHAIELDDTITNERIHIWHCSGSFEEISNAPSNPGVDDDTVNRWPTTGPAGWNYVTAGGVQEPSWKGRRVRRTMDSSFDIVRKDKNELIERDHNVSIANTETVKIGSSLHWTIGWKQPPENRKNDNKSGYPKGGLGKNNFYIDIANTAVFTTGNNYLISVGYDPKDERRVTDDQTSFYMDVRNNIVMTAFNNIVIGAGLNKDNERKLADDDYGGYYVDVSGNQVFNIGLDQLINVKQSQINKIRDQHVLEVFGSSRFTIKKSWNIDVKTGIKIKSPGGVTITEGNLMVKDALGCESAASGSFTTPDGRTVTVLNGIVTGIS